MTWSLSTGNLVALIPQKNAQTHAASASAGAAHQGVGAAGDDEVDDIIMNQQLRNALARRHEAYEVSAHFGRLLLDCTHDDLMQHAVAVLRLLTSLKPQQA